MTSTSRPGRPAHPDANAMKVKGSFFMGRKSFICGTFGEARWNAIMAGLAKVDPVFATHILATSLLPAESYVLFQETLVRELFAGDENGYWIMGENAGEWALTEGPYRPFLAGAGKLGKLVDNLPKIWDAYFTAGRLESALDGDVVDVRLVDLPLRHVSLELTVMGFGNRALELCVGKKVRHERVTGVSDGHGPVHYRYHV